MKIKSIDLISPLNNGVVLEIILENYFAPSDELEFAQEGDLRKTADVPKVVVYKAIVKQISDVARLQYPELQVDDKVLVTQFAGYQIAVNKKLVKLVNIGDIMAIISHEAFSKGDVSPSAERVVIEVLPKGIDSDQLMLSDEDVTLDPLVYGTVVQVGSGVTGVEKGQVVAIDAYVGETISSSKNNTILELRICNYRDILLLIK